MFPVNDFNFVVAGIATFAATVGYACTRKFGAGLSGPVSLHEADLEQLEEKTSSEAPSSDLNDATTSQDQNITTSTLSRQDSLKRKVPEDGFDEDNEKLGYPHNLANIYPNKRSRTPSSESDNRRPRAQIVAADSLNSTTSGVSDEDIEIPFASQEPQPIITTPAYEPPRTPSPIPEQSSPGPVSPPPTLAPVVVDPPRPIAALPKRPSTPKAISNSSGGFAAFAGSTSPFASLNSSNNKPQHSEFKSSRSIWTTTPTTTEPALDHKNELESSESNSIEAFKPAKDIGNPKVTLASSKYTHITGEEEEEVELELKGVKLFVKRGEKSFSDGMLGHVKLLSNRTTLDERILFRREPLWKVSMNLRVQPTVRCSFVEEENVLRIVLKEAVGGGNVGGNVGSSAEESSDSQAGTGDAVQRENTNQEVVVYALKPGRACSKQDFKEFAQSLTQSSHFKTSSIPTSVTAAIASSS
ncbi:hypothetical protein BYT27DRAFT_7249222 [Phlegmacium glaucopus]|nr:hypothetical protein BYT27DRAFT_7249222 [Phlegmacium glaucopus]